MEVSKHKIPRKIKEMLDSEDCQMANLGASLMRAYVPKEEWTRVLEIFSLSSLDGVTETIYKRKWGYSIEGDEIEIIPQIQGFTWRPR